VHRIGGTCLLIQPTTSVPEIVSHIGKAEAKALFVCEELLPICKQIFDQLPASPERTYSLTESRSLREALKVNIKSLPQLLKEGQGLPKLGQRWMYRGEALAETAYLCATSGTSGLQVELTFSHTLATSIAKK
jgi:long-subunit acyl-CoA synthetase (AMP-forming)